MKQKSIFYVGVTTFLLFSFCFVALRGFHNHYIARTDKARRARLYLKSDVCTNHKLRIQLGPEAKCAQKEMELRVSPFHRAVYDSLEDYQLCGHKRCEAMVQFVQQWKWLFFGMLCVVLWFYVQAIMFSFQVDKMRNFQSHLALPGGGSHLHLD